MAASVTSSFKETTAVAGTWTTTGTITPSGTGRILYALIGTQQGTPGAPTAVKFGGSGGVSMTLISTSQTSSVYHNFSVWRLINPSTSAGTIYITGATDEKAVIAVAVQDGDPDGTPEGTIAKATGASADPAASADCTVGDLILSFVGWGDANSVDLNIAVDGSATSLQEFEGNPGGIGGFGQGGMAAGYFVSTANPQALNWTLDGATADGWVEWAFAVPAGNSATFTQTHSRFRADSGNEATPTWLAAEDANITAALSTNVLLRLQFDATGDPAATAYTLRHQKNGAGGYTAVPIVASEKVRPIIDAGDCTLSGNNTAQATWAVSHPAAATGDLLIFYIAWDDSTATTDVTEPSGVNGETLTEINATPVTDSSTETRAKAWYCKTTGSWTATTITFTPSATESWSASVIKVLAGEFDATTPIGAIGTSNDTTGTDTTVDSPAFSAGASDGSGALVWCAGVDTDPLSATPPTGWAIVQNQDLGAVAHGVAVRTAAVTDSESIASATWSIAGDSWTSIAFVVRAPTVTYPVYVSPSSNIAAGGEATTGQLTAASGSFVTGRRWDDENGTDTLDLTTDNFTEVEWCLQAQSPAVNTDYFDFRVYAGTTAFATYTVTPRLTIGSGSPSITTGVGALVLTGVAPTLRQTIQVSAGVGDLVLTGQVPTAQVSGASPSVNTLTGALTLAGFSPAITQAIRVNASTGALTLTGYAPGLLYSTASPLTASLVLTGQVPTISVGSAGIQKTTDTGSLVLTGNVPTLRQTIQGGTSAGALTLTGVVPAVTHAMQVSPAAGALALAGFSPTVAAGIVMSPVSGSLVMAGIAPTLKQTIQVPTGVGALVLAGVVPAVTVTGVGEYVPQTGALTLSGQVPTIRSAFGVLAGVGALTLTGYPPAAAVSTGPEVTTLSGDLILSGYAPAVFNSSVFPSSSGAGKPRKPRKRKVIVSIDGEEFEVASEAEAVELLDQAKAQAEQKAAEVTQKAIAAVNRPKRKVLADVRKSLATPKIEVSKPLQAEADKVASAIAQIYADALRAVEISALMRRQADEQDDEDILLMLL